MKLSIPGRPKPQQPALAPVFVSDETQLILRALQEGKIARARPMPLVRRPLR